jgi:hypothetical protein
MICKSAIYYFLAGATAWGFIVHLGYRLMGVVPMRFGTYELTASGNMIALAVTAALTVFFLYQGYNSHVDECHMNKNQ